MFNLIYLPYLLFILGIFGFLLNRHQAIFLLIILEILIISSSLLFLLNSLALDDIQGQIFTLFILAIAGGESAIGLALILTHHQFTKNTNLNPTHQNDHILNQDKHSSCI
jgi:NADH-ubiquinone oxidoreductase chain 4L